MSNTNKVVSMSTKSIENLLLVMPKMCSCHLCKATKNIAIKNLGEKKYKVLCTSFGIYH
jgi:hypothetical protein